MKLMKEQAEEDLPLPARNTRLLLEDSWEQVPSRNKNQKLFCKIERELNHTLVTRKAFQLTDPSAMITEKATHRKVWTLSLLSK